MCIRSVLLVAIILLKVGNCITVRVNSYSKEESRMKTIEEAMTRPDFIGYVMSDAGQRLCVPMFYPDHRTFFLEGGGN